MSILRVIAILMVASLSSVTKASNWEFSAHIGQSWAPDLNPTQTDNTVAIDDGNNFGFGIAWQDSPSGMGQVLISQVSHDYVSDIDQQQYSLDILYGHFNGIALFRQENYITTVSLGLGGARFDSEFSEQVYPSASIAIGTRYEFSDNFSFFTELRANGSLVDEEDNLFCQSETCHAEFEDGMWMETNITIGIAFRF